MHSTVLSCTESYLWWSPPFHVNDKVVDWEWLTEAVGTVVINGNVMQIQKKNMQKRKHCKPAHDTMIVSGGQ